MIDAFVERIERRIDERRGDAGAKPARTGDVPRDHILALAIISLGVSIPLIAIAGSAAGLPGVIAVCVAIVLVNVVFRR